MLTSDFDILSSGHLAFVNTNKVYVLKFYLILNFSLNYSIRGYCNDIVAKCYN